jgi:hypothetical protein
MAGYIGTQPVPQATQTRETFVATAGQTSFATSGYVSGYIDVYLNGIKLTVGDYTATNGSDIVLTSGANLNDVLDVISYSAFSIANPILFSITTTATSKTIVNNEFVSVTSASQTITLPAGPSVGSTVYIGVGGFTDTVVGRNGSNIMSIAEDLTIDAANVTLTLTYIDASIGWRVY